MASLPTKRRSATNIRQVVCDIPERAIEDGLVAPRWPNADDPDPEWKPHLMEDEELAGCFGLLRTWLRRHAASYAAACREERPPAASPDAPVACWPKHTEEG